MNKHNKNLFFDKFKFLHSQELNEEISWSCSDSSDYENTNMQHDTINITSGIRRKRKRVNNLKKERRNVSNLDITIVDRKAEQETSTISAKSPILHGKLKCGLKQNTSVLTPHQFTFKITNSNSLNDSTHKHNDYIESTREKCMLKSPIIQFKNTSPKVYSDVQKKLFKCEIEKSQSHKNSESDTNKRTSPILSRKKHNHLGRKTCENTINDNTKCYIRRQSNTHKQREFLKDDTINNNVTGIKKCSDDEEISIECSSSEESVSKSHTELAAKVKSYFDNHFISEASQLSISEYGSTTPGSISKSSNEIDNTTPNTEERNETSLSKVPATNTLECHIPKKKVKYKKDGLAYRLNTLLKKQNSSVTLWQHERFLAANSNFVIPKQEFLVFRIKNVLFKFGIYLLEIVNKDNNVFIAIINSHYINNNKFEIGSVLKIYEPFKITETDKSCRIICNICKFECEKLVV